jgi:uncharacterized protein (DUF1330 family)
MSCYFIAGISITDETEYSRYLAEAEAVFAQFRGRYLAVDKAPLLLEGSYLPGRVVLIEFPDKAEFARWYHSADYQRILRHRLAGSHSQALLVSAPEGE